VTWTVGAENEREREELRENRDRFVQGCKSLRFSTVITYSCCSLHFSRKKTRSTEGISLCRQESDQRDRQTEGVKDNRLFTTLGSFRERLSRDLEKEKSPWPSNRWSFSSPSGHCFSNRVWSWNLC
jgi:hypothetical protein